MGTTGNATHREPWNKGKMAGQKAPFKLKDIWALRVRLQMGGRVRELALFNRALTPSCVATSSPPRFGTCRMATRSRLQRLRTGGSQTVNAQHVNVQSGAQAVIGNVGTGGSKRRGRSEKVG